MAIFEQISTLYHGSTFIVETPTTMRSNPQNDFGSGFYTTTNRDEAVDWATKKSAYQGKAAYLNVYGLVQDEGLTCYEFDRGHLDDLLWLDFILMNRGYDDCVSFERDFSMLNKDILIGPIADNRLAIQMNLLTSGLIEGDTLEETKLKFIGLLLPDRLDNQVCFKNDFALSHLRFREVEKVG
ncbi:MAG: DUF3990 domain-containing protein [Eggerthellaceae bacterium]|nr:DUF3990 domain-containing protein [Eggerthellaceae bacterium]